MSTISAAAFVSDRSRQTDVVGEFEVLDVPEPWFVELAGSVSDEGIPGIGARVQQRERRDPLVAGPAPIEVSDPVDPVVVWTAEGELRVQQRLDRRAVVSLVGPVAAPDEH
jgi:hypothetical protein